MLINVLYITKWLERFLTAVGIPVIFDVTPIVFSWSFLIFVYATFNNNLLALTPLLRREVVSNLNTPIIVLDSGYYVVFYNEKVKEIFKDRIEEALAGIVHNVKEGVVDRIRIIDKTIEMKVEKVNLLEENQYLVLFHDLSSYVAVHDELSINKLKLQESNEQLNITITKQEELSKEVAKKYVARELHDIVGHSLVVSIKLLEVAKLYIIKDRKLVAKEINDASTVLNEGIVKMNNISNNNQNEYYGVALRKYIAKELQYPEEMGIETKLIVKGESVNIEAKIFDIIAKVTSELITNTLKHANAKAIFVNLSLNEDGITMLYIDDGAGCKELKLGNGLKGIEARIKERGGNVYYNTSINNGFMTKLNI